MNTPELQAARIMDVLLLGPFMVWFALRATNMPDWAKVTMAFSGLATMWFNGRNYIVAKEGLL